MPVQESAPPLWEAIADLMTSDASVEEILAYRPSPEILDEVRDLLHRSNAGELTSDDQRRLSQFEQAELFMRLVKARLRPQAKS